MKGIRQIASSFLPRNLLVSIRESFGQSGKYYRFGIDDNAINKIIESVNDSPTARMCVDRLNQFVFGKGFAKPELKEVFTSPNVNLEQFTRDAIKYLNVTDGFVIRHQFNNAGQSARKRIIPIQYVRKRIKADDSPCDFIYREGLGDQVGTFTNNFSDIIVPNWEVVRNMSPSEIRQMVDSQVKKYGYQIGAFQYVYIPQVGQLYDKYPVPTHFSGMPDLRADAGLSLAEENAVSNSFKPQWIVVTPKLGRVRDADTGSSEYDDVIDVIETASGPDGANSILLETNSPELVKVIPLDSKGRVDEAEKTTDRIQKKIVRYFGLFPTLVGFDTAGKLGDNQEIVNKMKLLHITLEDRRKIVYEALEDAYIGSGEKWTAADFELEPLNLFDYLPPDVIKMLTPEQMQEIYNLPETVGGEEVQPSEGGELAVNDAFANLSGRQLQGIQRVVRKFNKGELTKEQAGQLLSSGFAMTPEQIDVWLIEESEA